MNLYVALTGASGLSVSGFLLLRALVGESLTIVAVFNTFLHLLVLPSLLILPLSLLLRRPRLALTQAAPVALFLASYGVSFLPRGNASAQLSATLTLLTYNIHSEAEHLDPMVSLIREANADVVALQELRGAAAERFRKEFANLYPYQALHPSDENASGQGVLSRYPITADEYWRNQQFSFALGHQRVEIDFSSKPITLYNAHPVHPAMTGKWFDALPRGQEINVILERASKDQSPVLIAGDFNMPDQSEDYFRVTSQYGDSFRESGWGMGFSFPDLSQQQSIPSYIPTTLPFPPFMRLDYVFHSRDFQAVEARVWPTSGGSDHRPLFVTLALGAGS